MGKNQDLRNILFLVGLVLLLRIPTLAVPILQQDEAFISMRANEILSGGELYQDIISRKPPLSVYLYALIFSLFGKSNLFPVHFFVIFWVMATVITLYSLTLRFWGRKEAFWAAMIYTVFSHAFLAKDFLSADLEIFMLLPLTLSSYLFLSGGRWNDFTCGFLVGIAFLFKQQGGIQLPILLLAALFLKDGLTVTVQRWFLITTGFFLPILLIAFVLHQRGTLDECVFWCFTSNYFYITQPTTIGFTIKRFFIIHSQIFGAGMIIWIFGVWEIVRSIRDFRSTRTITPRTFCTLWFVSTLFPVLLGFRFFPHYYLQIYPPLGILAGIRFFEWFSNLRTHPNISRIKRLLQFGFLFTPICFWIVAFFPRTIHLEPDYKKIGNYVVENTLPEDRIFLWGNFVEVFWYTRRNSATRLYSTGFITGASGGRPPDIGEPQLPGAVDILFEDFSLHPPELILDFAPAKIRDQQFYPLSRYPLIEQYVRDFYFLETIINDIHVYRRKKETAD